MTYQNRAWGAACRTAAMSAILAAIGCRSTVDVSGAPSTIIVVAGGSQSAAVGSPVPAAPTVRVQDGNANGVPGITVLFSVLTGGGAIIGDSAKTDADGRASVGQWILGTSPGINSIKATVSGTAIATSISATATPGNGVAIRISGQQGFIGLVGQIVTPAPSVLIVDTFGNPVPGTTVTFSASSGGGSVTGATAVTNANGIAQVGTWTLGPTVGSNTLTAQAAGGASLVFTAQALTSAPLLTSVTPTTQSGYLKFPVTNVPRVLVKDALGRALAGVTVTFNVTAGDGTITGGSALTGSDGMASPTDWRMGIGASTSITATAALGAVPLTFTATGVAANFLIDVRFLTAMNADQRDAFVAAARKWMTIIAGHLNPVTVNLPQGACSSLQPAINEVVTDVIIFAEVTPIDGVGNVLGSASPCASRSSSDLTVVGTMEFDSADLQSLVVTNQLVATITHEMAHVLGFGTTWSSHNLTSGIGSSDPRFTGVEAVSVWPAFSAALGFAGTTPPVENLGGSGTAGSHWRESVFHAELMTGYIESPGVPMPISRVTIGSLKDLGYQVDYGAADIFAGNLMAANSTGVPPTLLNEKIGRATWKIDATGGATRIP